MKIINPTTIISRDVLLSDLDRVKADAKEMAKLCKEPIGIYSGGKAIAHSQITDKDPLRFFVTVDGDVVINPKIIRQTKHTVDSLEGCLSFPNLPQRIVPRSQKIVVEFTTIEDINKIYVENASGPEAFIIQHEIGHFNGEYIYPLL